MKSLLKLADKPVTILIDKKTENAPAAGGCMGEVAKEGEHATGPFEITLYEKKLREEYKKSLVYKVAAYSTLAFGVAVHELGHTLGDIGFCTFDAMPSGLLTGSTSGFHKLLQYTNNCIEDNREEHQLMMIYPSLAPYAQLQLSSLRWSFDKVSDEHLKKDLDAFFFLTRFGVVIEGSDPFLVNAFWPVINAATVNNRYDALEAAIFVALLLQEKHPEATMKMIDSVVVQQAITGDEAEKVLAGASVIPSATLDTLKDAKAAQEGHGKLAGADGPPPDLQDGSEDFYREATIKYVDTITSLRNVFTRMKYRPTRKRVFEGDLSPRPNELVKAYIASMTNDDSRSYLVSRRTYPDIQLVVLWDTSSSTSGDEHTYGYGVVALLAALEEQIGCQSALIAYNSKAVEVMPMGKLISKTKIHPIATGGTCLMPALKIMGRYNWTAREKYLAIITDGQIQDWQQALSHIEDLGKMMGLVPMLFNVAEGAKDAGQASVVPWACACSIEEMPDKVMATVLGMVG